MGTKTLELIFAWFFFSKKWQTGLFGEPLPECSSLARWCKVQGGSRVWSSWASACGLSPASWDGGGCQDWLCLGLWDYFF